MDGTERRERILSIIKQRTQPIKGIDLAKKFGISRQVIVQDIAILRAAGENILATPQGYLFPFSTAAYIRKTIACRHRPEEMIDELMIMVDMGAKVLDVTVEHPVYGEIKSLLMISSRKDLKDFIEAFEKYNAEPLSSLTEGIHIHTIEVPDEETHKEILQKLKERGFLVEE